MAQPVVQAIASTESQTLTAALSRLGRNPRDVGALIAAGNAALASGDVDAAVGFFERAGQIAPANPKVKAGLAGALVRNEDPYSALPLFDEADQAGALDGNLLADRGLAYDLLADNATAQRIYRKALSAGSNDEATRRLALSLAISGEKRASEALLTPLLQRQDKAAWRSRAFALAIGGQEEEAVALTRSTMPQELASGIAPYLRYMRRLTPAQQAAAANLGHFPRASEIGHDDPRIAQYAAANRSQLARVDRSLIPAGEPLGRKAGNSAAQTPINAPSVAPPAPPLIKPPVKEPVKPPVVLAAITPPVSPPPAPTVPVPVPVAKPVPPTPKPLPAPTSASTLGWSLPPAPIAATPKPSPTEQKPPPEQKPPAPPSLADAFADLAKPADTIAPAPGAVDMRRIKPQRESDEPEKPDKPAPPSHPSRIWVELGIGRDRDALAADWHRLNQRNGDLLKGRKAFVTPSRRTNMMLTGPFETQAAADAFAGKARKAGINGSFVWTSPAGQVVDGLAGR